MTFRKLRIAWSVGCGIACVLLIALWVRSYSDSLMAVWGSHYYFFGNGMVAYGRLREVAVPLWSAVAITAAASAAPWFRWRFTLRTLLIATTLIAVVLGTIIALRR
jgi:hypothetical protein